MIDFEEKVGSVMVVGGGIAGIQASLDLANSGFYVYLVESTGAIGGAMAQMDKTFPTNDCAMCILSPKLVECGRHLNIQLMTMTEMKQVEGELGNFTVFLRQHPRFVDVEKCIACGKCAQKCPQKVPDEFNRKINTRKAIFVKYPQAVPLKYQIDPVACNHMRGGRCRECEAVCPCGAIMFDDYPRDFQVKVGSIILAPGYRTFDPTGLSAWGYGRFPNVITAIELERYLAVSGPTSGNLVRPSDGKPVRRMAFLQCIGSRDYNQVLKNYCSSVCCMYAIKQAMIATDHNRNLQASIFHMDIRTPGKDFERFYDRARHRGIAFQRCRIHAVEPGEAGDDVTLRYLTENGKQISEQFDMVVLSVGMEPTPEVIALAERLRVALTPEGFAASSCFSPVHTSRPGIYACGVFAGPSDIPLSVIEASAAATAAAVRLSDVRYSLSRQKQFPPERNVEGEKPRIGVFVCNCGSNIADVVNVHDVARYAASLPEVVFVEKTLFACSQDSQEIIRKRIEEERLNRIVIASCTPRTHEPLFRETLRASGLNECLIEMANIRNQLAWVHAAQPDEATEKAKDLVRMAVSKAALLEPVPPVSVRITPQALVIGGGLAGMTAALGLADQGFPVHLVEKAAQLGGNTRHLFKTWKGEPIPPHMDMLASRVREHSLITIHLKSAVVQAEGYVGSFTSTIHKATGNITVDHGVVILATGGQAFKPVEYDYGLSQDIFTSLEFDKLYAVGDERIRNGRNFVFIQCVGSREPDRNYCSRVCCTHSIQSALTLKQEKPERRVFVLHRDVRTYGLREDLYRRAREQGVIFINYDVHQKPNVVVNEEGIEVIVWDHVLHEPFSIPADVVTLATAIVPNPDTRELAKIYKLPVDADGFLLEAHVKLRPVDFATDGIFLAGLAHYPKPIEESIAQAQAAVARAVTVLSSRWVDLDLVKARVDPRRCDACALCVDACPYEALAIERVESRSDSEKDRQELVVRPAKCKGCGTCQATCPKEGISVTGFSYAQLSAQVRSALTN
ncbi:MAG: FAD-dependent oxidoreductase [Desulfobacteraceae bacterium]|nr:FAD-dependent oxidoreductase [Desulfobacteraceae bacterium]